MTADFIIRTDHGELKLTTDGRLTQEEWDTLTASLAALYVVAVPEGTRTVTELLEDLPRPIQRPSEGGIMPVAEDVLGHMTQEATANAWGEPAKKDNTETFRGPLDSSVMGLRLAVGDVAVVTQSHREAHVGTMHRWIKHPQMEGDHYGCGHGGCTASVSVESEPF